MKPRFLLSTLAFLIVAAFAATVSAQNVSTLSTQLSTTSSGWGKGGKPKPTPTPTPGPHIDGETDWKNTGTDFNNGANWTAVSGTAPPAPGDVAWFKVVKATNPNLSADTSIAGLYFSSTASSGYTLSATSPFVLTLTGSATDTTGTEDSNASAAAIGANNTSGTNTISAPIILAPASGTTSTISQASGGTLVISGAISGSGITLSKIGAGTLTLSGANTYSGGTNVSAGLLALGSSGTVSSGVIASGPVGTGTLTLGTGTTLRSDSTSTRTIQNNVSLSGTVTFGSTSGTLNGTVVLNSSGLTTPSTVTLTAATTATVQSGSTADIENAISGAFSLTKSGSGTLVLGVSNSFSGGLTLQGGVLAIADDGALGSGTLTINNTSSNPTIESADATAHTITNTLAALTGSSLNVTFGATTGATGDLTFTKSLNVGSAVRTFTVNNTTTFSGGTAGTGGVTKQGNGTLILSGSTSYSGATTIGAGKLEVSANGGLGSTSGITVNSGGTLVLSNSTATNRISNTAGITLAGGTIQKLGAGVNEGTTSAVGFGALTLTASSTLDYTGTSGVLTFTSFSPSTFTLSVTNYVGTGSSGGTDQLIFNQDEATRLGSFDFGFGAGVNVAETALGGGFFEVYSTVPVPEPSTWCAAALAFLAVGYTQRRKLARVLKKTAVAAAK